MKTPPPQAASAALQARPASPARKRDDANR
jgi:hypothetical protein